VPIAFRGDAALLGIRGVLVQTRQALQRQDVDGVAGKMIGRTLVLVDETVC